LRHGKNALRERARKIKSRGPSGKKLKRKTTAGG
jgi:hypothetical protein